jgi:hypothetical protein
VPNGKIGYVENPAADVDLSAGSDAGVFDRKS